MKRFNFILVILFYLGLIGCSGLRINRLDTDFLKLGVTTARDVISHYGEPQDTNVGKKAPFIKTLTYGVETSLFAESAYPGGVGFPLKANLFYFVDEKFVGELYTNSFKSVSTDFDESKIKEITIGKTTREQVVNLFGKPAGRFIYPLTKSKDEDVISYGQVMIPPLFSMDKVPLGKSLEIVFRQNVVVDVAYCVSTVKLNPQEESQRCKEVIGFRYWPGDDRSK